MSGNLAQCNCSGNLKALTVLQQESVPILETGPKESGTTGSEGFDMRGGLQKASRPCFEAKESGRSKRQDQLALKNGMVGDTAARSQNAGLLDPSCDQDQGIGDDFHEGKGIGIELLEARSTGRDLQGQRKDHKGEEEDIEDLDLGFIEKQLKSYEEEPLSVMFRKHSCNTSWCPICGLRRLQAILLEVFQTWDWKSVRSYVLTVDRGLYSSPYEAYLQIQRAKELAEFQRRVRKKLLQEGLKILDYFWLLEWHKDGYPHWHFYVLVNKRGKAGRINPKINLTEAWGRAKFVKEGFIQSYGHWKRTLGYVAKHGYFVDGKKEQAELPAWAKESPYSGPHKLRIKRFERMRTDLRNGAERAKKGEKGITKEQVMQILRTFEGSVYDDESGEWERPYYGKEETWKEKLSSCGAKSFMTLNHSLFFLTVRIDFPYQKVKKMTGEYRQGEGYFADLSVNQVLDLLKLYDEVIDYRIHYEGSWP
jgi:hypothetical protein